MFHEYFGKLLKLEMYGQMLMVFLESNRKVSKQKVIGRSANSAKDDIK